MLFVIDGCKIDIASMLESVRQWKLLCVLQWLQGLLYRQYCPICGEDVCWQYEQSWASWPASHIQIADHFIYQQYGMALCSFFSFGTSGFQLYY